MSKLKQRVRILVLGVAALALVGCSTADGSVDATEQISQYLQSDNSQTKAIASAASGAKQNAAMTFIKSIGVQWSAKESGDIVEASVSLKIPEVRAIQEVLASSDSFVAEYGAVNDKESCIYNYATNALLSLKEDGYNTVELSATSATVEAAVSDLQQQADAQAQSAISEFLLATLYSDTESVLPQEPTYVDNLQDFVALLHKNKILVSNVQVFTGEEALDKIIAISEANKNLQLNNSDNLFVITYKMTNLSKKTITLDNMFHLGDSSYHLYENTGFHVEGLTPPSKVKYGETIDMTTALIGNSGSSLYFYDASLKGARCWKDIPTS